MRISDWSSDVCSSDLSDSNAQTTPTGTVYRLDLPNASGQGLEESMKILAGMIAEPTINDASVNAERAVITAEQREGHGPQIRMADATRALFFAGQTLATHSPKGPTKTLQAAEAKRLDRKSTSLNTSH